MSTFPVKFKLSDLLVGCTGVQGQPFVTALRDIEKAGNWPLGMEPRDNVYVSLCLELRQLRVTVDRELDKKQHQTPFTPNPMDLTPQALDLSVEAIPVATANQFMRAAFDPEHLFVVMGDPETDPTLQAMNVYRRRRSLPPSYLYLEQMPDTARIVLESNQPS